MPYLGLVGGRGSRAGPGPRWRLCWADVLVLSRLPWLLRWTVPPRVSPGVGLGAGGQRLAGGVGRVGGAFAVLRVGSRGISRTLRGERTCGLSVSCSLNPSTPVFLKERSLDQHWSAR